MFTHKKKIVALASAAIMVGSLAACSGSGGSSENVADDCTPAHEFETITEGQLTIANVELPPYAIADGNEAKGVDGDILTEFAEANCLEVVSEVATSAASIPAIQSGRADIGMGNFYRTAERAEIVEVSDPIYIDQMALMSADGVSSISDIEGMKVGTVDGYLWVSDLREVLGDNLSVYNTALNLYQDLENGRIDVAADSFGSGIFSLEGKPFEVVVAESDERVVASTVGAQSMFPITQGNTGLTEAVNAFLAEIRESGRLEEILVANGLDASAAEVGDPRLIGE